MHATTSTHTRPITTLHQQRQSLYSQTSWRRIEVQLDIMPGERHIELASGRARLREREMTVVPWSRMEPTRRAATSIEAGRRVWPDLDIRCCRLGVPSAIENHVQAVKFENQ